MRKSEVSSTLTVYHDGQFWVGVVEHVENDMLKVERVVFGAEPSNEEVYTWVLERWSSLRLSAEAGLLGHVSDGCPATPSVVRARRPRRCTSAGHRLLRNLRSPASGSASRMNCEATGRRGVRMKRALAGKIGVKGSVAGIAANSRYSFGRALFLHLRSVGRMAPRSDAHSSTDQSMF